MNNSNLSLFVSGISILIALTLAGIKIWETWRDRFRLQVWNSSGFENEKICLANPTRNTILITHWDLVWIKKKFWVWFDKKYISTFYDGNDKYIRIEPCNYTEIEFNEPYEINWKPKEGGVYMCLEMQIAGRKNPLRKIVQYFRKSSAISSNV